MEIAIVITALIVCGTAWDIARRFAAHRQHIERLSQLTELVHCATKDLSELSDDIEKLSDGLTGGRIELAGSQADIRELQAKLTQACEEWREVFATVDARNDETRKEVLTKVAGLLHGIPRAGFNR